MWSCHHAASNILKTSHCSSGNNWNTSPWFGIHGPLSLSSSPWLGYCAILDHVGEGSPLVVAEQLGRNLCFWWQCRAEAQNHCQPLCNRKIMFSFIFNSHHLQQGPFYKQLTCMLSNTLSYYEFLNATYLSSQHFLVLLEITSWCAYLNIFHLFKCTVRCMRSESITVLWSLIYILSAWQDNYLSLEYKDKYKSAGLHSETLQSGWCVSKVPSCVGLTGNQNARLEASLVPKHCGAEPKQFCFLYVSESCVAA